MVADGSAEAIAIDQLIGSKDDNIESDFSKDDSESETVPISSSSLEAASSTCSSSSTKRSSSSSVKLTSYLLSNSRLNRLCLRGSPFADKWLPNSVQDSSTEGASRSLVCYQAFPSSLLQINELQDVLPWMTWLRLVASLNR